MSVVTATTTTTATNSWRHTGGHALVTAASSASLVHIGPNKPMVPTATRALAAPALHSRRQHIGQPLGRRAASIGRTDFDEVWDGGHREVLGWLVRDTPRRRRSLSWRGSVGEGGR